MQEMVNYFVGKIPEFLSWLNSMVIVNGVSLLGFFAGILVIVILIRNFLLTAR